MSLVPVEDNTGLVKDVTSKAVLSKDHAALLAHRNSKNQSRKVAELDHRIEAIEQKLDKLLEMLAHRFYDGK